MSELTIRTMRREDLDLAVEWAAAEGWNPGREDADSFFAADPAGYFMGFVGDKPVTAISVVSYGDDFGFLGLYICRPEFRGKGYGYATWQAGMAKLSGRTVGLDGVVAQQANYARSGFALAHRNVRYGGPAIAHETASPQIVALHGARPAGLAGAVIDWDRGFFPAPRPAFLRQWLASPSHRTTVWVEDNAIRGYGTIRAALDGWKIGPLFANTAEIADRLFAALTSRHHGEPVFLDVPDPNRAAMALAGRYGLTPVFETARMYRGDAPTLPLDRIFGITSFELG